MPCLLVWGFYAKPVLCFKILTGDLYFDSLIIGPFRFVYLLVRLSEKEVNGLPKKIAYGDLGQKETAWCLVIVMIYTRREGLKRCGEVKVVIRGKQTTKGEGAFFYGVANPIRHHGQMPWPIGLSGHCYLLSSSTNYCNHLYERPPIHFMIHVLFFILAIAFMGPHTDH